MSAWMQRGHRYHNKDVCAVPLRERILEQWRVFQQNSSPTRVGHQLGKPISGTEELSDGRNREIQKASRSRPKPND
ncbi:hypothetical protein RJ639_001355 [Escallonia herrerae]|uniref:Uncharacterized protein n=1 Tax=Escallonia herrerae TaxID=1293975 RepID=A0AA88XGZ3_9ASTE|nr:hypothetical protein RJ639_001355 [Escallonia herrerae]